MRIIAGSKARFKLIPPKDRTTRPITDRVKESLFSILYPYLEGAIVADIFCGTGSLGLEAVSRGARHAILVDQDFDAINRLKQNISHLQFYEQTTIRKLDAYRFGIPRMEHIPRPVDLVFIDPPFAHLRDTSEHSRLAKLMRKLAAQVADEALAVIRHEARVILPESFTGWQQSDRRDYGSMAITFYTQIPQLKSIEEPQDEEPGPFKGITARQASIQVVHRLRQAGHEALFAGGCVRDMLLKHRPSDFDVATSARPGQIDQLFKRTLMVGAQFGVVVVLLENQQVEVATFRSDADYRDGRRPDHVVFTDARHDALRRDFTINGMFYDPVEGEVIDYVGGQDDLKAGIIRAIGRPLERFQEDHLRIMRAVRFSARLQFAIEPATWRAICDCAGELERISSERIMDELGKIVLHPSRDQGLWMARQSGILPVIFPELNSERLDGSLALIRQLPRRSDFSLVLAGLMVGHPGVRVDKVCRRLKLSNDIRKKTSWLCDSVRLLLDSLPLSKGRLKQWLAQADFPDLLSLCRAYLGQKQESCVPIKRLKDQIRQLGDEPINPPRFLDGNDLQALGCPPGPLVGELDSALYLAQLENEVIDREQAVAWVRDWLSIRLAGEVNNMRINKDPE